MEIKFEMKANPAPNSFAVITWRIADGKKDPLSIVDFTGEQASGFATEYLELQEVLFTKDTNKLGEWLFQALHRRR
jgi:hypothetical protein